MTLKAELHTHTLASDGSLHPAEVARIAAARGCFFVAVTDHDTFRGAELAIRADTGARVVPGIEVRTTWGDVLVLCPSLPGTSPPRDPWSLRDWASSESCIIIPAHPLHPGRCSMGRQRLVEGQRLWDAIETWNPRGPPWSNYRTIKLAEELLKPGISGSDAHVRSEICSAPVKLHDPIETPEDLIETIIKGELEITRALIKPRAVLEALAWAIQRRLRRVGYLASSV